MSKTVSVDPDSCIGCQTCALLSPDIFGFDNKTFKAFVKKQPDPITSEIKNTINSCPVNAIKIK